MPPDNVLYLAVLPLVPIGQFWAVQEQAREYLTLVPNASFATEFFEDEVDGYIDAFNNHAHALVGGHVTGFTYYKERTLFSGRIRVKVVQHVQ